MDEIGMCLGMNIKRFATDKMLIHISINKNGKSRI